MVTSERAADDFDTVGRMNAKLVGCAGIVVAVGVAWANGDWSGTQHKADDFKSKAQELKRAAVDATKKLVRSVCDADEDSRKDAARNASSEIDNAKSKERDLERLRDEVYRMISDVNNDDKLRNDHSDASRLKSDMEHKWDELQKIMRGFHDSTHPAVERIIKAGDSAHHDHLSRCDARDVDAGSHRAECLIASGETCTVMAIAPDNSNGIRKAYDRAKDQARYLSDELGKKDSYAIKHLIDSKSSFKSCKKFEAKVDCFKVCPSVSDDGEIRESSADWRSSCS